MKIFSIIVPIVAVGLFELGLACAQEPSNVPKQESDIESLKKQMIDLQAAVQQMQTQHQQEIDALKLQIQSQQKVIDDLQKSGTPGGPPGVAESSLFPTTDASLVLPENPPGSPATGGAASPEFPTTDASVTTTPGSAAALPFSSPISIAGGGKTYMNLSFDAMFTGAASTARDLDHIEVGDHDPQQRGFNARNLEIALDGAVDPYFEGFANIVFKLDNHNETEVEAEEAFLQTTSLPYGLQVKGGQFFAPFGRINPTHPHTWDFADAPLVQGRLLGPDGLRGVGVQVSWVAPLPWYSQFILAIQNGQGGTGYSFRNPGEDGTFYSRQTIDRPLRGPQDLTFISRWENSFDLSPTQTVLAGLSAAVGPNDTGPSSHTQIYGADLFYKWKPPNAEGGWPFVKWQSEGMYRHYEAGRGAENSFPVSETFTDWGAYSQVVWGFRKGWTAGIRGDFLSMDDSRFTYDLSRQSRWRASGDLTFYPSEFSKIRLQYNHDFLHATHSQDGRSVDSVFLQYEFGLGSHGAHKF